MKIIDFPGNTRTCNFSYHKVKDGPNYFVCYYKGASRMLYDPLSAWRTLEMAKHTDTGKALKEWCLEMAGEHEVAAAKEEPVKKPTSSKESEHAWHFEEKPVRKPTFSQKSIQKWGNYDPNNPEIIWRLKEEPVDGKLSEEEKEKFRREAVRAWSEYEYNKKVSAEQEEPNDNTRTVI